MKMKGVQEYAEDLDVEIVKTGGLYETKKGAGRWVIQAVNEGGYNHTQVDVLHIVGWLRKHRPEFLK